MEHQEETDLTNQIRKLAVGFVKLTEKSLVVLTFRSLGLL